MVATRPLLYINYNPATLVRDEQLLARAGYQVDTVLGTDGVLACKLLAEDTFVLIDKAGPVDDRKKVIRWLTANFPRLNILSAA